MRMRPGMDVASDGQRDSHAAIVKTPPVAIATAM